MEDLTIAVAECRQLAPFQTGGDGGEEVEEDKVISNQKLFIQTFEDHRGRPGKVGGSLPKDSSEMTLEDFFKEEDEKTLEKKIPKKGMTKSQKHRARVERVLTRLGFPTDRVESSEEDGYLFNVGGQSFRAAADYDPKTGKIRVFDVDNLPESEMEGILAHEIMHDKFQTYVVAQQAQFTEIHRSIHDEADPQKWLIKVDGSIRNPEDRPRFWAWEIQEKYLTGKHLEFLQKSDGVTAYSDAYWEAVRPDSPYSTQLAINETLAEIARKEANLKDIGMTIDDMQAIDPIWKELYKDMKRGGVVQNRLFHFGGEGSGFRGHAGRIGQVGGSSGRKGLSIDSSRPLKQVKGGYSYFLKSSGQYYDVNEDYDISQNEESPYHQDWLDNHPEFHREIGSTMKEVRSKGIWQVREHRTYTSVSTDRISDSKLHELQGLISTGKINGSKEIIWSSDEGADSIRTSISKFLQLDSIRESGYRII